MKANYYLTRDATLEAHEWSFAMKRFTPARLAEAPDWGAAYQFSVPSDIIRVTRVQRMGQGSLRGFYELRKIDRNPEADGVLESGNIITDEDAIVCKGIRRIEDEGQFSPLFNHAFSAHLAMLNAYQITQSTKMWEAMSALYTLKINEAKTRDGLQGSSRRLRNRSLSNVR